ncbi:PAAR domain-containing protein [Cupriavidus agavae]|uniref:Putative Zn-binding protein involved in type VI secretion n=1 Tax=Cupriavidus agavae TaxID=1001822 RepID=A0A4Q7RHD3_9BURK|nr:PAAR domain-containing protein [Cupriavidus agavae]RZT31312.1 putative Zn-binding protein involved in type VI secretion [Cupriavidus agavae]
MKTPALLGDRTSHGGSVKTASSTFLIHGRRVALVGDVVSCPVHGDNPITEGGNGYSENARKLVVDGCRTACGSTIIAGAPGAKFS